MDSCPLWIIRLFPFLRWWPMVNRRSLRADLLAGLTGAIVVLPQGVAFATIAGMPPEYGLYAGMIPAIIAALYGSSWHLVSGPTTAASVVLFSSLSIYAEPASADYVSLALTLTFMVGVIQLLLGAVRLGTLVNFISHSVVVGFTAGAAILIIAKQLKNFFGVPIPRGGNLPEILQHFAQQLSHINPYVTGVALLTLLSGIALKHWYPRLPYMIVAMLVGSLASLLLNNIVGTDVTGIITIGALPATLPPFSGPDLSLENLQHLAPTALAVTLFALTEAVSIGRSLAARSGQHIDGNQEFIGQGLSNLAGSFFSGYVATGSFNRSGLNYQAGAKTPLAAVFAGALLIGIVLLVAPLAAYLPNAAMAGVLFLVAWGLIDFKGIAHTFHSSRAETSVLATTLLAALFLELEFSIFLGVLLSLVLYLNRTSRPTVVALAPSGDERRLNSAISDTEQCPQLRIVRVDGSLFFGAVGYVQESLRKLKERQPGQQHVLLVAAGINFVDLAGVEMLERETKSLREAGGDLYLCNIKPGVEESLRLSGMLEYLGEDHLFHTKKEAISAIVSKLNPSNCDTCSTLSFAECAGTPASARFN